MKIFIRVFIILTLILYVAPSFAQYRGGYHGGYHHGGHGTSWSFSLGLGPWWGVPYYWGPPVYYSPPPVYVVPSQPPPINYWYYCQNPQGYYPYINSCPGGWMKVVPEQQPR